MIDRPTKHPDTARDREAAAWLELGRLQGYLEGLHAAMALAEHDPGLRAQLSEIARDVATQGAVRAYLEASSEGEREAVARAALAVRP